MKHKLICVLIATGAAVLSASPSLAQFGGSGRWQQDKKRSLCRQSIGLAGVEEDMDRRIRDIVRDARSAAAERHSRRTMSARVFEDTLDDTLNDAKEPILDRLLDRCTSTFSVSELRGINDFYRSPAGKAWLRKGRTSIMPEMERAVVDIQPRIREAVERRYCERMGC